MSRTVTEFPVKIWFTDKTETGWRCIMNITLPDETVAARDLVGWVGAKDERGNPLITATLRLVDDPALDDWFRAYTGRIAARVRAG